MTLLARFKKWALAQPVQAVKREAPIEPEHNALVGEPVTSFIASLKREPKRYKLTRVLRLSKVEFPGYSCYHWMNGAGHYKLLDRKTGVEYAAYVHDTGSCKVPGSVYDVYGLPFKLNHWELEALFKAFQEFRLEARKRRAGILEARGERERLRLELQEKQDRLDFAKQFR